MPATVLSALLAVQILFGLNYVLSKIVVEAFPPLVWASLRAVVTALLLLTTALVAKRPFPKGGREFFLPALGFSFLAVAINQGSFLKGLQYTTSINSAVLNTTIPIFTLLIVTLRGQEPASLKRTAGFVIGLLGVLVMRRVEDLSLSNKTLIGDLLTIVNCVSYSIFLSYGRSFLQKHDAFWTTGFLFAFGSISLSLIALPDYAAFSPPELTPRLLACMAFAIVGGTLLTYFLNLWALARARSSSVALFIYVQPIVTAAFAWSWLGQAPSLRTMLASALIFAGLLLGLSRAPAEKAIR